MQELWQENVQKKNTEGNSRSSKKGDFKQFVYFMVNLQLFVGQQFFLIDQEKHRNICHSNRENYCLCHGFPNKEAHSERLCTPWCPDDIKSVGGILGQSDIYF